jgi:DNA invertase Pin-like site-specific DNA recombinase
VTKAIGYIRVSTKDQGQNGFGLSAQRDAIETYCEANELELLTVVPDVMSGRKTDKLYGRAAAIAAIKAGIADVLVLKDFDRASRDVEDSLRLKREAHDEGWRIVTTKGEDTAVMNSLELTIKLAFAEEERHRISERTKAGLARVKREGKKQIGRPSTIGRNVIDRIVAMRISEGLSAQAIARKLTNEGVPTPGGGATWAHSTVRGVFAREGIA